ncbi:MAG: hypothetical protein COT43_05740 [Candidatus Marinimicrobia bacterium CG08_land_8_20_14_0_20_45_22]|nr:MAG: hypothetical protein COT43_05740 [Candidatus Marinimicrobia bacterium CG08_land_8_20_14_0_20_45_22]
MFATALIAQNIQLNYDLRRECFTTTVEIFKPDKLGSLFTFIDFNYENQGDVQNASMSYWEIARYFTIPAVPKLAATIQYNDGLTNEYSFNPVWLGGVQYVVGGKKFSLLVDFLIRKEFNTQGLTFQLTTVWFYNFKKVEISGFIDVWNTGSEGFPSKKIVFLSEPQFWYKITNNILIGGEIEISRNFNGGYTKKDAFEADRLFILPTLGVKWYL